MIKNISIDNKIKEYKQWKELIDNVLQEFRKCDKTKLKVIEYKSGARVEIPINRDCSVKWFDDSKLLKKSVKIER